MGSPASPLLAVDVMDLAADADVRAQQHVDPFLLEALENPRHRLIVLRMELDIQSFMQNPHLQEFEFPHFPTSYLRCAAHRVAQHYGLETTVVDSATIASASRIVARKTAESKYPPICLSDVPGKQVKSDNNCQEKLKIFVRQRPKGSQNDVVDMENKRNSGKTVEERKEEYEKARDRIFKGSGGSAEVECLPTENAHYGLGRNDPANHDIIVEKHTSPPVRDGRSTVAIFRDLEKDRSDPDYDRSYGRYVRGPAPNPNFIAPYNGPIQLPFMQGAGSFPQSSSFSGGQNAVNFMPSEMPVGLFCNPGYKHPSRNSFNMPQPLMVYGHYHHNLSNPSFQVPSYQSFDHLQHG